MTDNTLTIVQLPAVLSGPRHGGQRHERTVHLLINGKHWRTIREGSTDINWAHDKRFEEQVKHIVAHLAWCLECKPILLFRPLGWKPSEKFNG